jgi:hypothetical protein
MKHRHPERSYSMSMTEQMLNRHPGDLGGIDVRALAACVDACLQCEQACTACADACLSEEMIDPLRACIRFNLDCADICAATARVLSRQTGSEARPGRMVLLAACAAACRACGDQCAQHAETHEHCRICAELCRRCEEACNDFVNKVR